jgi:predicted DNA-binding transcriptional regulator AlpA
MRKIDRAEIAALLDYSVKHVRDYITKRPDFPKPVQALSSRRVYWDEADVRRWAQKVTQAA